MNLIVHVPYDSIAGCRSALGLAERAPSFTVERVNDRPTAVAIFPSLPEGIDVAVELIGESMRLMGAWASVNAKPFSNLVRLWQRLVCYRGSLGSDDPVRYCREQAARFNAVVVCEGQAGPVPCQFIAMPCPPATPGSADLAAGQYELAAALAEVDWCPRLNLGATARAARRSGSSNGNSVRA